MSRIEQIHLLVKSPIELFLLKGINVTSVFGLSRCLGRPDWDPDGSVAKSSNQKNNLEGKK